MGIPIMTLESLKCLEKIWENSNYPILSHINPYYPILTQTIPFFYPFLFNPNHPSQVLSLVTARFMPWLPCTGIPVIPVIPGGSAGTGGGHRGLGWLVARASLRGFRGWGKTCHRTLVNLVNSPLLVWYFNKANPLDTIMISITIASIE